MTVAGLIDSFVVRAIRFRAKLSKMTDGVEFPVQYAGRNRLKTNGGVKTGLGFASASGKML